MISGSHLAGFGDGRAGVVPDRSHTLTVLSQLPAARIGSFGANANAQHFTGVG